MILRRAGSARQEVELVAPDTAGAGGSAQTRTAGADADAANPAADAADARAELPQPLCPQGSPGEGLREDAKDLAAAPGASPLDEAIDKLPQVRRADEMGGRDEPSHRKGGEA